ncbi:MAG TPA: hypothetical protein VF086_01380 [Propionibacteriaceae bacterium]
MSGFPSDLRARVYRNRAANGSTAPDPTAPDPTVGLRLRGDPFERHGRVWQWVVDIDPGLPTLTEVLASCHDFLVDDDCGREVGVVEGVDLDPDSAAPEGLRVVQGWGRRRTTVSIDEVIEVTPGERRLVIACREGLHRSQSVPPRTATSKPADMAGRVRSLVARLSRRRTELGQR